MRRFLPLLMILTALLVAAPGCGNKPDDTPQVDRAPQSAVMTLAREVQAKEAGVLVVPRLGAAIDAAREAGKGLDELEKVNGALKQYLGVSVDDRKTWAKTGMDLEGPMLGLLLKRDPVVALRVKDPSALQAFMSGMRDDKVRRDMDGPYPIWRGALSWRVVDGVVFISESSRPLRSICTRCVTLKGSTLAEDKGFWAFQRELIKPKTLAGFYLPTRGELYGDMAREFADELDYGVRRNADFGRLIHLLGRATGAGLAIEHEAARTRVDGWLGMDAADAREVTALLKPDGGPGVASLIRADAGAFARMRVSPAQAQRLIADLMSLRGHAELEEALKDSGVKLPEQIARLGGEAAVAWYPALKGAAGDKPGPLNAPVALTLTFKKDGDATATLAHVEELMRAASLKPERREVNGVQVLTAAGPWPQPRVMAGPRVLIIAGLDIDEATAAEIARGASKQTLAGEKDPLKALALDGALGVYGGKALINALREATRRGTMRGFKTLLSVIPGGLAAHVKATPAGLKLAAEARPGLSIQAMMAEVEAKRKVRTALHAEAEKELMRLAQLVKQAREAAQVFDDAEGGAQPWYAADPKDPARAKGQPVPQAEQVFPGGLLTRHLSKSCVPQAFEQDRPRACREARPDKHAKQLSALFGKVDERFRLTYTTNGKRGVGFDGARATVRLEVDMNGSARANHTLEVFVTTDKDGKVRISPLMVLNEYD